MFGATTATVIKYGDTGTDARNNPIAGPTGATFNLVGCRLDQLATDEILDQADTIVATWVLIAPAPTSPDTVTAIDRIEIDGVEYQIEGRPDELELLDGAVHHLEIYLRRTEL